MITRPSPSGDLTLGHVLAAAGVEDFKQVVVVRHTFNEDGLRGPADAANPSKVLDYTRAQEVGNKLGKVPAPAWLVFMADGARRSRLLTAYENHGEVDAERTDRLRFFDLRESGLLFSLRDRLVIEWGKDTVNWAKLGTAAAAFAIVEIADLDAVAFPGFDRVLVTRDTLRNVIEDSRYTSWRTALGSVQGVYLITDTITGHLYVGMTTGADGILGRWRQYARDGHGGNQALLELAGLDANHAEQFQFSILRVFGPNATPAEIGEAESHFKRALLTRQFGLNRN
jgi:hypothetical protein